MFKISMTIAALLISVSTVSATELRQIKVFDGLAANCTSSADLNYRMYRLNSQLVSSEVVQFTLESLVCVKTSQGQALVPVALAQSEVFNNKGSQLVYAYSNPVLQITNTEGTREFLKIPLDGSLETQTVQMNLKDVASKTATKKFDVSVQLFKVVTVNGQFVDERTVVSGSYRIFVK